LEKILKANVFQGVLKLRSEIEKNSFFIYYQWSLVFSQHESSCLENLMHTPMVFPEMLT